jgi:hypothetical protein
VPVVLRAIAVATLLLPEEASFFVGDLRLTVARAIFLVIAPYVAFRAIEQIVQTEYRFVWSDFWTVLAAFWMVLSVWQTEGANRAIVGAGIVALDFTIPYLAARFLLQEPQQVVAFCRLLASLIAIAGLLAILDTFAGRWVTHDFFASLTGYVKGWRLDILMRNNFLRASGPFEHPILLGTICGDGFLLATALRPPVRIWLLLGTGIGVACSISAGPIGGMTLGLILLLYARLTPEFEGRWRLVMRVGAVLLLVFYVSVPNPFGTLITHFTFDQQNSYYRLMVWQIAGGLVLEKPLFGIGMEADWPRPEWMPPTVDSVWLASAMAFGIVGSLLIFLALVGATSRRVDIAATQHTTQERELGRVLSVVLSVMIYTGFTVHYWGATWILLGLLAGTRASLGAHTSCAIKAELVHE